MNNKYFKYENLRPENKSINKPLVSLITVVKNNEKYIQKLSKVSKIKQKKILNILLLMEILLMGQKK